MSIVQKLIIPKFAARIPMHRDEDDDEDEEVTTLEQIRNHFRELKPIDDVDKESIDRFIKGVSHIPGNYISIGDGKYRNPDNPWENRSMIFPEHQCGKVTGGPKLKPVFNDYDSILAAYMPVHPIEYFIPDHPRVIEPMTEAELNEDIRSSRQINIMDVETTNAFAVMRTGTPPDTPRRRVRSNSAPGTPRSAPTTPKSAPTTPRHRPKTPGTPKSETPRGVTPRFNRSKKEEVQIPQELINRMRTVELDEASAYARGV